MMESVADNREMGHTQIPLVFAEVLDIGAFTISSLIICRTGLFFMLTQEGKVKAAPRSGLIARPGMSYYNPSE